MTDDELVSCVNKLIDSKMAALKSERFANRILPSVYHYTSISSLISIIKSGRIWASNCLFLNDAEEIHYMRDLITSVIDTDNIFSDNTPSFRSTVLTIFLEILDKVSPFVFVLSMSNNHDSLPLWTGCYLENGCCIEFNFKDLFSLFTDQTTMAFQNNDRIPLMPAQITPVTYDPILHKKAVTSYTSIMAIFFKQFLDNEIDESLLRKAISHVIMDVIIFSLSMKKPGYSAENELRISFTLDVNDELMCEYRIKNNILVPYIEINLKTIDKKIPINQITLSPLSKSNSAISGITHFLKAQGYDHVDVTRSDLWLRY